MIRYIRPVAPRNAQGLVGDVYRQIRHEFGAVVDPFALHSASPRLLAAVWSAFRESALVGVVPREIKEAVAVAVSQANHCPFCVDAHVVMLYAMKAHRIAQSLLHGRRHRLSERTQAIVAWAGAVGLGATNGTRPVGSRNPFFAEESPEVIGTAVFFHYMNRMASVLLDDTPLPSSRRWLRAPLARIAGWYFSFAARRPKAPGASLAFLPDEELPADLDWAAGNAASAGAWARLAREIERQGKAALPDEVRAFAIEFFRQCDGAPAGNRCTSIEYAAAGLSPEHRGAGRLALLTALAPHQVDERVIRAFADPEHNQEMLLGALSWASFAVARRIGDGLHDRRNGAADRAG